MLRECEGTAAGGGDAFDFLVSLSYKSSKIIIFFGRNITRKYFFIEGQGFFTLFVIVFSRIEMTPSLTYTHLSTGLRLERLLFIYLMHDVLDFILILTR
jgi:hypothetical protein